MVDESMPVTEEIELILEPYPPDTTSSVRDEFEDVIRSVLRESGQEHLLDSSQIKVDIDENIPIDIIVTAVLTLTGQVAIEIFKVTLLPEIKKRYKASVKQGRNRRKK